jgi:meso-butanediol dehydrogenase / (S,S)-butanediol dehydrogenase / diacetyl reductase
MKLQGKVALITGGGTGIGAAIAKRFVDEGARVCITGRRQQMLDTMAQSLSAGTVKTCAGDVSNPDDVKRMVATALEFGGRLDILVNNAAMEQPPMPLTHMDPALWNAVISVNLSGPFLMMRESIPHIIQGGGGSIINISSLAGVRCLGGMAAYSAAKAGLNHLTQQTAVDYGPMKVRCNVVCPGAVRTEMFETGMGHAAKAAGMGLEEVISLFTRHAPLRRAAIPDELSGVCVFLGSDDSSFMTGTVLMVDGGVHTLDVSGTAISEIMARIRG